MERAEGVVAVAATELFAELRRVEDWPRFTEGLHTVVRTGHHRYRWDVVYAGQRREVDVVVSFDHRRRTVTWKSLHRPAFDGGLRLVPLGADRTRVQCWLAVEPVGFMQTLMAGPHLTNAMAVRNLQRLAQWVASRPRPDPGAVDSEDLPSLQVDLRETTVRTEP